jgi:DNA helicase-2/ATP-dependent DNA helicase PcrA
MEQILTQKLNSHQKEAVLHSQGPLIIFAGAGTGKTRVITYRIAYLLSSGISPNSILAVTFTNKAAAEMKSRVVKLAANSGSNVWISTFHSFCAYFLRMEASKIKLNLDFLIYDFADQRNIIHDCIKELNIDEKKFKPNSLVDKISRAKDELKSPQNLAIEAQENGSMFASTYAKVYELYQKKLVSSGALDFGDLIMYSVEALQNNPQLLEKYQERYKYIMVDEYQDTNRAQYVLIKLLSSKYKNLCVVGDDDQSVYSWRGADVNNILDFEKDYSDAKTIKLEQNYRSTPKILKAAYNVIKNNSARVEKQLWTQNEDVGEVSIIKAFNENDESARVASLILNGSESGKFNLSDCAVFYRTNAQSRVFEDAFRRSGIPYSVIGTLRFYDRQEIKNIMAYLKLIHNHNDFVSFKRVVNVPTRKIGKISMEALENFANKNNLSAWDAISKIDENTGITSRATAALKAFKHFIEDLTLQKDSSSVKDITQKIITSSGYLKELENENTLEATAKIENIKELISAIDDFENRSPDKSLSGYLTQIALISDIDALDESKGKVTLMTLHLAKGMEYKNVFLCGLEEGLFPIGEAAYNAEEVEEERRLMYVGMTRAKQCLYLCWATERTVYGKTKWNFPSRFVAEAGFREEFEREKRKAEFQNKFGERGFNSGTRWKSAYKKKENDDPYNKNFSGLQNYKLKNSECMDNKIYNYVSTETEISNTESLSDSCHYKIGTSVFHPVFGKGKIIEKSGIGQDLKIIVLFNDGQWKKLLVRVANLTIL